MMKLRRRHRHKRVKAEMNVVPYIDVMLVLLVIFMIAAPLINQAIEIDLPQSSAEQVVLDENDPQPLVLSVDPQAIIF
ncbi:biopolymer transporter ExbD [Rappaport israeli]|uniref:biopolymer transporter ExbD n=1 Tax=Rappaport israeli TaxID=1839807 RepID=UPI000A59EE3C|nr:biopolymer transporter ExbD [Rappaport israeli]